MTRAPRRAFALCAVSAWVFAACASVPSLEQRMELRMGQWTLDDFVADWGRPSSEDTLDGGGRRADWIKVELPLAQPRLSPTVGPGATDDASTFSIGGTNIAQERRETVTVWFGADGLAHRWRRGPP